MSSRTALAGFEKIRRPLVWLVVLAIVVYGHSATLVQLLGPSHRHEAAAQPGPPGLWAGIDGMFRELRAWRAELNARLLPAQPAAHASLHAGHGDAAGHAALHAAFERHHHDPQDDTVVLLDGLGALGGDGAGEAASAGSAGSAALPLALAPGWALHAAASSASAWPAPPDARWTDAALPPSERPPRA